MHLQMFTDANSILPALGAEFILEVVAFISMTHTEQSLRPGLLRPL